MSWKDYARSLRFEQNLSVGKTALKTLEKYPEDFRGLNELQVYEKVKKYLRSTDEHKERNKDGEFRKESFEYHGDGVVVSEKFITLKDGQEMTPEFIMEAHGLKVSEWDVVSYKNNFWNSQLKGGHLQISYQSKLTVKPKKAGLDFDAIDKYFETKQFKYDKPLVKCLNYDPDGEILEIDLPDLHSGLLAWRGETGRMHRGRPDRQPHPE